LNPDHSIQYIVVDGDSSDDTLRRVRESWIPKGNAEIIVISEPDTGMYDALAKGLVQATGDAICYMNAGDYCSRYAMQVVSECFLAFPKIRWLTGMSTAYTSSGAMFHADVPWSYSRKLIRSGHYGGRGIGSFIQQESTFWRRELISAIDIDRLRNLSLAGDQYLWYSFAKTEQLFVVAGHLGGFRYHGSHLSEDMVLYKAEVQGFSEGASFTGNVQSAIHRYSGIIPPQIRQRLKIGRRLVVWNVAKDAWELIE